MYTIQMSTYWKSKVELKEYVTVKTPDGCSFGGSQSWFASGSRRESVLSRGGCGLVALGDFFLTAGKTYPELYPSMENGCFRPAAPETRKPLERQRYLAYLRSLGKGYLTILPKIGANAWQIWAAAERYRRKSGSRLRPRWGVFSRNMEKRIRRMLEAGLPVLFCVGPDLNPFCRGQKVPLYQMYGDCLKETARVRGHYMSITGLCTDRQGKTFLQVSSWGRKYYISLEEYRAYRRKQPPLLGSWLSNLLYWNI